MAHDCDVSTCAPVCILSVCAVKRRQDIRQEKRAEKRREEGQTKINEKTKRRRARLKIESDN